MANRPRLIAYREDDLGLTQQEVANRLNISRSFYCRIEGGLRNPNPLLLKKFAAAFGLTLEKTYELFYGNDVTEMARTTGTDGP